MTGHRVVALVLRDTFGLHLESLYMLVSKNVYRFESGVRQNNDYSPHDSVNAVVIGSQSETVLTVRFIHTQYTLTHTHTMHIPTHTHTHTHTHPHLLKDHVRARA